MEKRETDKSNSNHKKVFYFLNILFMCMITAASLAMAVILFIRLERLRNEEKVEGTVYTDGQIEKIKYEASQQERNRILLDIQSSFESGNSTISMLGRQESAEEPVLRHGFQTRRKRRNGIYR